MDAEERAAQQFAFLGACSVGLLQQAEKGGVGAVRVMCANSDGMAEVALLGMDSAVWLTHVRPLIQKLGLPLVEQNPPK
jgi:hypothetical protein